MHSPGAFDDGEKGLPGRYRLLQGTRHAVTLSDVRCAGIDTPHAEKETTQGFELVLVRHGVMMREYRDRSVLLRPGSLVVFEREQPYRITHPVPGGDRCAVVSVPGELLREVAPELADAKPGATPMRDDAVLNGKAWLALRVGVEAAQRGDALCGEERLVRLLPTLLRQLEAPAILDNDDLPVARRARALDLAARVVDLISRRSSDDLSLRMIADVVHTSAFHLSRMVHAVAGAPIHRILVSYRLQQGVERLLDGEANLSRLALDIGFSSHSHFTTSFRTMFGVTPNAFRETLPLMKGAAVREARLRARKPLPRWAP